MLINNVLNIIPAASVMNTTLTSKSMNLPNTYGFAIQVGWTGTVNGTFELQVSADPWVANPTAGQAPVNWSTMPGSVYTTSTITSPFTWNFTGLAGYNWVRLVYLDSSGGSATGTITSSTFNGKGS
jgi:hypothetical protein